jgi:hypothetical protein
MGVRVEVSRAPLSQIRRHQEGEHVATGWGYPAPNTESRTVPRGSIDPRSRWCPSRGFSSPFSTFCSALSWVTGSPEATDYSFLFAFKLSYIRWHRSVHKVVNVHRRLLEPPADGFPRGALLSGTRLRRCGGDYPDSKAGWGSAACDKLGYTPIYSISRNQSLTLSRSRTISSSASRRPGPVYKSATRSSIESTTWTCICSATRSSVEPTTPVRCRRHRRVPYANL